jgi:hypothetical protein
MPVNPNTERRFRNSKYYLIDTPTTWEDAEAQAVAFGGHLVTINDAEEQAFLVNSYDLTTYWIGLNDAEVEGNFQWISGEPTTYTFWAPGEPSNNTGGGQSEDYVIMNWGTGGSWNDGANDTIPHRAIIEVPASFSIEDIGSVKGGSPGGERRVSFNLTNSTEVEKWNNLPVWIIVHGWNGTPTEFNTLACAAERAVGSGGLVLTLDWREAAGVVPFRKG